MLLVLLCKLIGGTVTQELRKFVPRGAPCWSAFDNSPFISFATPLECYSEAFISGQHAIHHAYVGGGFLGDAQVPLAVPRTLNYHVSLTAQQRDLIAHNRQRAIALKR